MGTTSLKSKLRKCNKLQVTFLQELDDLCNMCMEYFDFSDWEENYEGRVVDIDQYLESISIVQQTDDLCFTDYDCMNIPVTWVVDKICASGKITYHEFKGFSI